MIAPARMHPDDLAELARLVADQLAERVLEMAPIAPDPAPASRRWLTATEVAAMLGMTRDAVYRQADTLGAVKIGSGPKARLRFELEEVTAALRACSTSGDSPTPHPPPRERSRAKRTPASGRAFPLLPVREV